MGKQNIIELQSEKTADRLKEVTDRLEQGVTELFESERYKEYLRVMARFHNYSFNNTLLIAMQCPGATRLAGFQTWKKFGRHVKKGEKGIKVIAPTPFKKIIEKDGEEREVLVPRYKVVSTYDLSQTEGKPLPSIATPLMGSMDTFNDIYAALEQVSPVPIGFEDIPGSAYGYYIFVNFMIFCRYATLCKLDGIDWRRHNLLSLAGVYQPKKKMEESKLPVALTRFLEDHPHVKTVYLHLDNDNAGRLAAKAIMAVMPEGYRVENKPPPRGKDVNDFLCHRLGIPIRGSHSKEPER